MGPIFPPVASSAVGPAYGGATIPAVERLLSEHERELKSGASQPGGYFFFVEGGFPAREA